MNQAYRRLAQSLDEVAGLILVLAGEALAGSGFGGGRFLLQAPASELQARRDAVLLALRNLAGTTQEAYGNDEWPWGLHGLREVLRADRDERPSRSARPARGERARPADGRAARPRLDSTTRCGLRALGATADVARAAPAPAAPAHRRPRPAGIAAGRPPSSRRSSCSSTLPGQPAAAIGCCSSPARRSSSTASTASAGRTPRPAG